jgi:hypothetical protein
MCDRNNTVAQYFKSTGESTVAILISQSSDRENFFLSNNSQKSIKTRFVPQAEQTDSDFRKFACLIDSYREALLIGQN